MINEIQISTFMWTARLSSSAERPQKRCYSVSFPSLTTNQNLAAALGSGRVVWFIFFNISISGCRLLWKSSIPRAHCVSSSNSSIDCCWITSSSHRALGSDTLPNLSVFFSASALNKQKGLAKDFLMIKWKSVLWENANDGFLKRAKRKPAKRLWLMITRSNCTRGSGDRSTLRAKQTRILSSISRSGTHVAHSRSSESRGKCSIARTTRASRVGVKRREMSLQ